MFDRSIDLRVMRLRRKIERNPDKPEVIKTTKDEGLGTGLGLSVSRAMVREHGGDLVLSAASRSSVASPASPASAAGPVSSASPATAAKAASPASPARAAMKATPASATRAAQSSG